MRAASCGRVKAGGVLRFDEVEIELRLALQVARGVELFVVTCRRLSPSSKRRSGATGAPSSGRGRASQNCHKVPEQELRARLETIQGNDVSIDAAGAADYTLPFLCSLPTIDLIAVRVPMSSVV